MDAQGLERKGLSNVAACSRIPNLGDLTATASDRQLERIYHDVTRETTALPLDINWV